MKRKNGMGTLFRRNGWWYYKRVCDGHLFCKSCKTTDRAEAEKAAKEFNLGSDLPKKARIAALKEFLSPRASDLPISEVFAAFANHPKNAALSEETQSTLAGRWTAFVRWLHGQRKKGSRLNCPAAHPDISKMSQVTPAVASEFVEFAKTHSSPNTVNKYVATLRRIWKAVGAEGNPWEDFAKLSQPSRRRRALTQGEIATLIDRADGELKALFAIGAYTGLRMSDCAHLKWEDLTADLKTLHTVPHKTRESSGIAVALPVHQALRSILSRLPGAGERKGWVLPELADAPRWRLSDLVLAHFTACGLAESAAVPGYRRKVPIVGFHSLRASFVTALCEAGAPLALVQSVVGHVSPEITQMYYRADVERTRKYMERLGCST